MNMLVRNLFFMLVILGAATSMQSCGVSKTKAFGKEVKVPLSQNKYKSDKKAFRARGNAESFNQGFAERTSITRARAELAAQIETKVKTVTEDYSKQYMTEDIASSTFVEDVTSNTRSIVNQVINNSTPVASETLVKKQKNPSTRKKDLLYNVYTVVELNKDEIQKKLDAALRNDRRLKDLYEKEKFMEVFDKEMEALERENAGY